MSKIDNFPYPTPIPAKIWGVPFGIDPSCWGFAESEKVRLISREIIFAEFQPLRSRYFNVTYRRTETDNLPWQYRAPLGFARQKPTFGVKGQTTDSVCLSRHGECTIQRKNSGTSDWSVQSLRLMIVLLYSLAVSIRCSR